MNTRDRDEINKMITTRTNTFRTLKNKPVNSMSDEEIKSLVAFIADTRSDFENPDSLTTSDAAYKRLMYNLDETERSIAQIQNLKAQGKVMKGQVAGESELIGGNDDQNNNSKEEDKGKKKDDNNRIGDVNSSINNRDFGKNKIEDGSYNHPLDNELEGLMTDDEIHAISRILNYQMGFNAKSFSLFVKVIRAAASTEPGDMQIIENVSKLLF